MKIWGNSSQGNAPSALVVSELSASYSVVAWGDAFIPMSDTYKVYVKREGFSIYWYCANSTGSDNGQQGFNFNKAVYKYMAFSN